MAKRTRVTLSKSGRNTASSNMAVDCREAREQTGTAVVTLQGYMSSRCSRKSTNVRDRGTDLDKDTQMDVDDDSANGDSVIQWVPLSSINSNPSPAAPSQTHSGPGCDSTPGHTLVTAIQASSQ